jgi:hypothetical protein
MTTFVSDRFAEQLGGVDAVDKRVHQHRVESCDGCDPRTSPIERVAGYMPGLSGNARQFHLIERFTQVASDMILYRATIENPTLYATSWTIELPWIQETGSGIKFEFACHEGNHGLTGILAGARAAEKEEK